jgi:hypothetical protein
VALATRPAEDIILRLLRGDGNSIGVRRSDVADSLRGDTVA